MAVRFGYLAYNVSLKIPDGWGNQARACLYYGQVLSKTPISDLAGRLTIEEAHRLYLYDDNGLAFIHYLIGKVLGRTSFRRMQILHLLLDALLLFPIMGIGRSLGQNRLAILSGAAYSVFLPEIWLAASPGYDFWATLGLIVATWLYVKGFQTRPEELGRLLACFVLGTIIVVLSGIVRSTVIYFPFIFLPLFFIASKNSFRRKSLISLAVMGAWVIGLSPKLAQNYSTYGQFRVVRNSLGQNFWLGVGQFSNPYGIVPTDDGVKAFYTRFSGRRDTKDVGYDQALVEKAREYVTTHPLQYLGSVTKRAAAILSGLSMRCSGVVADVYIDSPGSGLDYAEAHARGNEHKRLTQSYGQMIGNAFYLLQNPGRVRFVYLLLMPLGLFFAFFWERQGIRWLAASPMIYTLMTLSPFDYTGRNVINAYASILPVCMLGLLELYDHLMPTHQD